MDGWTTIDCGIVGFSIGKPPEWVLTSVQEGVARRELLRHDHPDMAERIEKLAAAPLVAMSRYPSTHTDLNPSVQVAVRPLGPMSGAGPMTVLEAVAAPMAQMLEGFHQVEAPHPVSIGGCDGAAMRATCTISAGMGLKFKVMSRTLVVPRGSFVFIIGMTDRAAGSEVPEAVYQQILDSIEIGP